MSKTKSFLVALLCALILVALLPYTFFGASYHQETGSSSSLNCQNMTSLEALIICIDNQMPQKGSNQFVVPTTTIQTDWHTVVSQMLSGQCDGQPLLSLTTIYTIGLRTYENQSYCVLMEIADQNKDNIVDNGWGTFIVHTQPHRELHIHIAHPKADLDTDIQGIGIFKDSYARSFLMAGVHRQANTAVSSCQPQYFQADVAHNIGNLFQPAVDALQAFYDNSGKEFVALQFHGAADTSCANVDVYLTHGRNTPPVKGDKILDLQTNLIYHNPTWLVTVPGDLTTCNLHGSLNVQGRLLNGVAPADVCSTAATDYSGRFIHIEQKRCCRNASNWVRAIHDTWPLFTATKQIESGRLSNSPQLTYTLHVTNTSMLTLTLTITDLFSSPHLTPTGLLTWSPVVLPPAGGNWSQQIRTTIDANYIGIVTNVLQATAATGETHTSKTMLCHPRCVYLPLTILDT